MKVPIFYRPKPVFGFDVGYETIKVAQLKHAKQGSLVEGYGFSSFDPGAIKGGVVIKPQELARSAYALLTKDMVGVITTNRAAVSLPVAQTFTRVLELPETSESDLEEAVRLEAEQYVPIALDKLYIDFEVTSLPAKDGKKTTQEVLMVAARKEMVDSYLLLFDMLGLEIDHIEPSTSAIARLVKNSGKTSKPILIVDFGSRSTDLTVYNQTIRVTDTIDIGSENITNTLSKKLNITRREAYAFKSRHGLNKNNRQKAVLTALKPLLTKLSDEIKKIIRYYQDRNESDEEIEEIVMLGGGANLPGFDKYLKDVVKLKVTLYDPWRKIDFGTLQKPHPLESTLYATVMGSALYDPKQEKEK